MYVTQSRVHGMFSVFFPWKLLPLFLSSECVCLVWQACAHTCASSLSLFTPHPLYSLRQGLSLAWTHRSRLTGQQGSGHCCDYKHMLRHPAFDMGSNSASCVCTASTLCWLSRLSSYIITILNYLNTINISSTHHAFSLRAK